MNVRTLDGYMAQLSVTAPKTAPDLRKTLRACGCGGPSCIGTRGHLAAKPPCHPDGVYVVLSFDPVCSVLVLRCAHCFDSASLLAVQVAEGVLS